VSLLTRKDIKWEKTHHTGESKNVDSSIRLDNKKLTEKSV
jgi:hypothetical protein